MKMKAKASKKAAPKKRETAIVKVEERVSIEKKPLTDEQIIDAFDMLGITAKLDGQKKKGLFLAVAKAMKLNPILGELHAAEMGGVLVPVTDYKVYVDRAERSQRLEWWDVEEAGDIVLGQAWKTSTYKCTLVVKRRDWPRAWHYTVRFVEAVGIKDGSPNSMWSKRPWFMTWKCAVAGLRLILREDLGELPYIDAEIDGQANSYEEKPPLKMPEAIFEKRNIEVTPVAFEVGTSSAPVQNNTHKEDLYVSIMRLISQTMKLNGAPVPVFETKQKQEFKARADAAMSDDVTLKKLENEIIDSAEAERQKKLEVVK